METLSALAHGFGVALTLVNLSFCLMGVSLGTLIGVLPGIGSLAAVSMLLPVSFYLEPTTAIIMLAGVYYGAEYGGSTASILLNLPGTPSSAITAIDGYPMARSGRTAVALFITTISSFFGGVIGVTLLILLSGVLSTIALSFGPAEYFAIMVLGLVAAVAIAQGSLSKGIAMVLLGVLLGIVGYDPNTFLPRYTLGQLELADGISLVAVAMGLFGIAEVIAATPGGVESKRAGPVRLRDMLPTRREWRRSGGAMLRGSIFGSFFGALPGTGATISSFVSYAVEKRIARRPSDFGKGAIEGVSAPESANSASVQTAFIPTLTLGVPGSATMAIMLGALMIHGVIPGPKLISERPDVFWGLVASFLVGNLMLLILNVPLINIWVRLLQVPYRYLYPVILVFICIGVFSVRNSIFDVWLVIGFGVLGYGMRLLAFEPAPLLMGFVLGPMMEEHMRRALVLSRGDLSVFITRPISGFILGITALILLWAAWMTWTRRHNAAAPIEGGAADR